MKNPNWMYGHLGTLLCLVVGAFIWWIIEIWMKWRIIRQDRVVNRKFFCEFFKHAKPVYHISRAFWWCSRCGITLGMNPDLWTPEAMAEHSEMMRRPDRN